LIALSLIAQESSKAVPSARSPRITRTFPSNGTSINGVPCLEGEIMYIEPGDTLILGDVMCSIEFAPREPAGSGKA
jgi:hypothetical protein